MDAKVGIEMKTCMLCGKETEGSVGVAGIKWSTICQPCKDREDKALLERVEVQAKIFDTISDTIFKSHYSVFRRMGITKKNENTQNKRQ